VCSVPAQQPSDHPAALDRGQLRPTHRARLLVLLLGPPVACSTAWLTGLALGAAYAPDMGTVLHPVGPEPARTYWIRRALILGVVVIVVIIVLAVVIGSVGSPAAADDPPPGDPTLTTGSSSSTVNPATITPTATPTTYGSSSPSTASTPSLKSTPTSLARTAAPSPTPTKIVPVACQPATLRATLTGKQSLKPKAHNTFALSLINGAPIACVLTLNAKNYELKIYSGTDPIWSSRDCASLVKPTTKTLASQQALEWELTWNGRRSRAGCRQRPEIPKAGTYFATSQYAGAAPVQLRMILHR
jgi:hypothetical protein